LGALFPEKKEISLNDEDFKDENLKEVNIEDIEINISQPRKLFDPQKLEELKNSIENYGVLQPIIVRYNPESEKYLIIAGERRYRAAKLCGYQTIPALVKKDEEKRDYQISLIENIQREDLNPIEKAKAYEKLIQINEYSQEEVSLQLGINRSTIANSIRLLKLPDKIKTYICEGKITSGHARAILAVVEEDGQIKLADKIISEELSVRQAEKLSGENNKKRNKKSTKNDRLLMVKKEHITQMCRLLEKKFDTKVKIKIKENKKGTKGKIEIEYYSPDDFGRIVTRIVPEIEFRKNIGD